MQGKRSSIEAEIAQNQERLGLQRQQLAEAEAECSKYDSQAAEIKADYQGMQKAFGETRDEKQRLDQELRVLKDKYQHMTHSQQQTRQQNQILKELLSA